jgi:hypothetical protein
MKVTREIFFFFGESHRSRTLEDTEVIVDEFVDLLEVFGFFLKVLHLFG